jgi:hypothetical protein
MKQKLSEANSCSASQNMLRVIIHLYQRMQTIEIKRHT